MNSECKKMESKGWTTPSYREVYDMLEDEESKTIYLNRLNWLISGDWSFFHNIVSKYLPEFVLIDWGKYFTGIEVRTANDAEMMTRLENEAEKQFAEYHQNLIDFAGTLPQNRQIVLYGAGAYAEETIGLWKDDDRLIGFCCETKEKQQNGYLSYPVISPEELLTRADLSVVVNVAKDEAKSEIKQILKAGGYPEDQIYEIPVLAPFLQWDEGQYFSPDFIRYEQEEVFLDVGAKDLGSTLEFKKYCKNAKKIYAFEPDPNNFKTCLKIRSEDNWLEKVELLPYGAWSKRTLLHFSAMESSGLSYINEVGEHTCPVIAIDEAIDPADKVTMIKMDIEGAELEALKGAAQIIRKDKPKLAICIYHKPEDMTEIPLYIKELVPEYKLYIWHHSNCSVETVLYAVMP